MTGTVCKNGCQVVNSLHIQSLGRGEGEIDRIKVCRVFWESGYFISILRTERERERKALANEELTTSPFIFSIGSDIFQTYFPKPRKQAYEPKKYSLDFKATEGNSIASKVSLSSSFFLHCQGKLIQLTYCKKGHMRTALRTVREI